LSLTFAKEMEIRATDEELDISDDLLGHNITERMISDFLCRDEEKEILLKGKENSDPSPYDRLLAGLKIRKTSGPTLLEEKEDYLIASGSVENLDRFSSYFRFGKENRIGDHHHFDYFDGDQFIAPESRSAVVSLRTSESEPGSGGNG
jgi:hypothetical protein